MPRRILPALALGTLLAPAVASAQTSSTFTPYIDSQSFRPAPGPYNFLVTDGSRVDGDFTVSGGALFQYANRPVIIYSCTNGGSGSCAGETVLSTPIQNMFTLNLLGTLTLAHRIQLGIDVPLVLETGDNVDSVTGRPSTLPNNASQTGAMIGDPRINAKFRLVGNGLEGLGLAVNLFGQIPIAALAQSRVWFIGDDTAIFGGSVIGDYRTGPFAVAANVGVALRGETINYYGFQTDQRITWSLAASYRIFPRLTGIVDFFGSTALTDPGAYDQLASEVDVAARYQLGDVGITLGGGPGIARWVGTPVARAFIGVTYAPYNIDSDRDGIPDNLDHCPNEPEDRDGFQDQDGCPDPDNDGDRILDVNDRCPNDPEDYDHFLDTDGCPDRDNDNDGVADGYDTCPMVPEDYDHDNDDDGCPDDDRDHDGIADERDQCPNDPEDTDGFQDEDGCPDPDNDQDGIPDTSDQCSEQPETYNGYQDEDGCPDVLPDRDHDGIPDGRDRCPDQPETYNGFQDEDGCPDRGPSLIRLEGGQIQILQQINFATNSDRIIGAGSFRVLDSIAALLTAHTELGRVDVQGHTDDRGNADQNRSLSERRAESVRAYLTAHGIAGERILAHGFGPDRPLTPNTNAAARARNRRVEFHIIAAEHPSGAPAGGSAAPANAAPDAASNAPPPEATPASAAPAATPAATPAHPAPAHHHHHEAAPSPDMTF